MSIIIDANNLTAAQGFQVEGEAEDDQAGRIVSSAGDVNGDGFGDFIIAAPFNDAGGIDAGAAYVIFGKAGGIANIDLSALTSSEGFKIVGEAADDWTGSVSSAGDVNGDGFGDLIIGTYRSDVGGTNAGAAFVIFGKAAGFGTIDLASLASADGFRLTGDGSSDQAGASVSSAGDINGDGLDDIIIGAPRDDASGSGTGGAYVIFGTKSGFSDIDLSSLDASQGFTIFDTIDAHAGESVSSGDVNGDGFDDLIISAPNYGSYYDYYTYTQKPLGAAYIIFGKVGGPGDIDISTLTPDQGIAIVGEEGSPLHSVGASVGDVDGDGLDDFVVGSGIVYGSSVGFGSFRSSRLIHSIRIAGAGDVNGDGFADLIAQSADPNDTFVIYGRAGGFSQIDLYGVDDRDGFRIAGRGTDGFGQSVSGAGDINGDGFDDIVIGAPTFREKSGTFGSYTYGPATGAAYVIYGQAPTGPVGLFGSAAGQAIHGGAYDDTIDGREGNDSLYGGGGNDVLIGGSGNDLLDGGTGADTLFGGLGGDTYVIGGTGDVVVERVNEGTDTVRSNLTYTLGDNVENLTLTGAAAINGTGNALANAITGNGAANTIDGGAGNDVLSGGAGNDTLLGDAGNDTLNGNSGADHMTGGTGDDLYYVDNAGDSITEAASGGHDKVSTALSYVLGANVEDVTLTGTGAVNATGNGLANVLAGNGAANTLNGKAGADTMSGGLGDDLFYVDNVGDIARETSASGGLDRVSSTVSFTLGANVEQLTLTGTGTVDGTGNTLANVLTGNGAANILKGLGGADRLNGGAGDDTLQGGAAQDILTGGTGNDKFVFADGDTSATHSLADHILDFTTGDQVNLQAMDANTTLTGNQAFHFVGNTTFSHSAGELHYSTGGGATWVEGDTDGDGTADFAIYLAGDHTLAATDFAL